MNVKHDIMFIILKYFQYMSKMQLYTIYFVCKVLYMFRVVPPPIIRSAYDYPQHLALSHRYCYLPLSWKSWNCSWKSWIAAGSSNGVTNTRCRRYSLCAPDDGWRYHPKHVEQFPDINELCKVAFCFICIWIFLRCADPWTLNTYSFGSLVWANPKSWQ
jgi:hypothetical protein